MCKSMGAVLRRWRVLVLVTLLGATLAALHQQQRATPAKVAEKVRETMGPQRLVWADYQPFKDKLPARHAAWLRQFAVDCMGGGSNSTDATCLGAQRKMFPWYTGKTPLVALREQFRGRGIVLTIHNDAVVQSLGFLMVLKHLKSQLPVEMLYRNDELSAENQKLLGSLAGVTLKSIDGLVSPDALKSMNAYTNKVLAFLFSSFREVVLVDGDTVLFEKPEVWLDSLPGYRTHGAYFFRDRVLEDSVHLPNPFDRTIYDVSRVTAFTLDNFYHRGHVHFVESGVVLYDKTWHFAGALNALSLNLDTNVRAFVHGDKETYWMGLSVAGDENYGLHRHSAVAIGPVTKNKDGTASVCSIQPAHVADDGQHLLWMNSGSTLCKWENVSLTPLEAYIVVRDDEFKMWQHVKGCGDYKLCATAPEDRLVRIPDDQRRRYEEIGAQWRAGLWDPRESVLATLRAKS